MHAAPGWLPVIIAISAALAAWTSAWFSRRSFDRAHWPFVWPDWRLARVEGEEYDDEVDGQDDESYERAKQRRYKIQLRLRNDGPGVALDVMWSIERDYKPTRLRPQKLRSIEPLQRRRTLRAMHERLTATVREDVGSRSLPSGGVLDDRNGRPLESLPGQYMKDSDWSIIVRYSDITGRRWEYRERAFSARELASPPRRLRRRLRREKVGDDGHRWRYGWDW